MKNMIFLPLLVLLNLNESFAVSSHMFKDAAELANHPEKATEVYTGIVVEKQNKRFLEVTHAWNGNRVEIELKPYRTLRGREQQGYLGQKYLLYLKSSKSTVHEGKVDVINIEPLSDSRKLADLYSTMFNGSGKFNPFWSYCHDDSECIPTKDICFRYYSINNKHQKTFSKNMNNPKLQNSCVTSSEKKINQKCINYFCE